MGSGLGWETAEEATARATRRLSVVDGDGDAAAGVTELRATFDQAGRMLAPSVLANFVLLPMSVDGRGQLALVCSRHDGYPVLLIPGTGVAAGGVFPVDQRGLRLDQVVDCAVRHERRPHRCAHQ
jgi:hypothetical protein